MMSGSHVDDAKVEESWLTLESCDSDLWLDPWTCSVLEPCRSNFLALGQLQDPWMLSWGLTFIRIRSISSLCRIRHGST